MKKRFKYEELKTSDLVVGAIYARKFGARGFTGEPISEALSVSNQSGFRPKGSIVGDSLKYCGLYSTLAETDWPDKIDLGTSRFTYFGDNRVPGRDLLNTDKKGNLLLKRVFAQIHNGNRNKIPPFFVFTSVRNGDVMFWGLAVPGAENLPQKKDLEEIHKSNESGEYHNYRSVFTILETPVISRQWLADLLDGRPFTENTPGAWVKWIETGTFKPLLPAKLNETSAAVSSSEKAAIVQKPTKQLKAMLTKFEESDNDYNKRLAGCGQIHKDFLARWPIGKLPELLTLKTYAIGGGDTDNFCYWIERKTRQLGSILGATAIKFKVYLADDGTYKWIKSYPTPEKAFEATKSEILSLLKAAREDDLDYIKDNKFFKDSNLVRGKLLYLYFPEKYLNIFSEPDIEYYLDKFGINYVAEDHVIDKQAGLLELKGSMEPFKSWTIMKFGYFLWSQLSPPSSNTSLKQQGKASQEISEIAAEEGGYILPDLKSCEITCIDLDEVEMAPKRKGKKKKKKKKKRNYLAEGIRNAKLGDHAEKLVIAYERDKLIKSGKDELAKKVEQVSLDDDSLGYDVRSFTPSGDEVYIEVKATKASSERDVPFYLTENERSVMEHNTEKYYIYRVYAANTKTPQILTLGHSEIINNCEMVTLLWQVGFSS